jgi:hypothetical protein
VLLQCFSDVTSSNHIGQSPSTFYSLLTSLSRLVGDDARRRPLSAAIFEACVKSGQINGSVLNALSECQPELYVKLPFVSNGKYRDDGKSLSVLLVLSHRSNTHTSLLQTSHLIGEGML